MHELLVYATTWMDLENVMQRHRKPCFMTYTIKVSILETNIQKQKVHI